jgi:imidazolonepropionase-like amidohydrolase
MKRVAVAAVLPLSLLLAAPSRGARAEDLAQATAFTTAFLDVTVVPVDRERVIPDQTVLVKGGRIVSMGPSGAAKLPPGTRRVEGKGKFLMPGLVEMHAHLPEESSTEEIPLLYFQLFLCNGVTTVRALRGEPDQLALRDRIERGEILAPRLMVYGPGLTGETAPDPQAGVRQVRSYHAAGYDGIKITEGLDPATYRAVTRTARQVELPVAGHVPDEVGLEAALAAGQRSIEHLDGYIEALAGDPAPPADNAAETAPFRVVEPAVLDRVDEGRLPHLVASTIEAGAFVVPTLFSQRILFKHLRLPALQDMPGLQYLPPRMVDGWVADQRRWDAHPRPAAQVSRLMNLRERLVAAIASAGGQIMLGSDASRRWSVPGFSLRQEVQALAGAGLTPWQLVQAATSTPARYFGWLHRVGTVAVGKRADLILVDGNPLSDPASMFRSSGVMVNGRWLARADLDRMLGDIERRLRFPSPAEVKDLAIPAAEAAAVAGTYAFARGNMTAVVAVENGTLTMIPGRADARKVRLRSQGGGLYLVPEMKSKVTFEFQDGRAVAVVIEADAARLRGARAP